ncbi:MAG: UDP-N-acetylmuramate dehydrogenase [Acidobacteriota bacterium]|nr:UDP-N-acetylmuramate dehydrogenase [Acidobacteriota bacterium]
MAIELIENYALAPLTTLKVGGAARFFVSAENENEIAEAVDFARKRDLPLFVLGGGSNILISDDGFDGLVLKIANRGIEVFREENKASIIAQAGEDWDEFVRFCVEENLAGVECLSGIPGSVGATPVQNVGAYGQEVSDTIESVRVLERETGKFFDLTNADCRFAYRSSIFNGAERDRFIVLAVNFVLQPKGEPTIRYKDLQQFFKDREKPNLKETREAVLQIRRAKSMVIAADDPNSNSVGSFFKNPIVENGEFAQIAETARRLHFIEEGALPPHFPAGENSVKIPGAWLIEKAGFQKGYTKNGRAGISSNHTLAIVNHGSASAADILDLANEIQARVKEIFRVELKPEPVFVGF